MMIEIGPNLAALLMMFAMIGAGAFGLYILWKS